MISQIFDTLPPKVKTVTREKFMEENNCNKGTFYNRIEKPTTKDLVFFRNFWGISYDELLSDIELNTIKIKHKKKPISEYVKIVIDNINKPAQTELMP